MAAFAKSIPGFDGAQRLLQVLWMCDHGIDTASADGERASHLASHLSADAAEAGLNFHSPELHLLALRELLLMREEDAAVDEDRLLSNPLSSMPLAVNLSGRGPWTLNSAQRSSVNCSLILSIRYSVSSGSTARGVRTLAIFPIGRPSIWQFIVPHPKVSRVSSMSKSS